MKKLILIGAMLLLMCSLVLANNIHISTECSPWNKLSVKSVCVEQEGDSVYFRNYDQELEFKYYNNLKGQIKSFGLQCYDDVNRRWTNQCNDLWVNSVVKFKPAGVALYHAEVSSEDQFNEVSNRVRLTRQIDSRESKYDVYKNIKVWRNKLFSATELSEVTQIEK